MLTTPGKSPSLQKPPIKSKSTPETDLHLLLTASILAPTVPLHAQGHPPPAATESPAAYEPLPTLDASVILQPSFSKDRTLRYGMPCRLTSARTTTRLQKIYLGEASVVAILLAIIPYLLLLRAPVVRLAGRRKGRP
jgi:hypothetical protein